MIRFYRDLIQKIPTLFLTARYLSYYPNENSTGLLTQLHFNAILFALVQTDD